MSKAKREYIQIVIVMCLAGGLVPFMGTSLNLALPHINSDLGLTAVTSSWLLTTYLLATAIFQIPCARLADMVGRKKIFVLGAFLFFISALLSGFATSGTELLIYRFVMGLGSAMIFATSVAILVSHTPDKNRGKALGINTAAVYGSLALAPIIGGFLTDYFGWTSIFFAAAGVGLITTLGGFFCVKDNWKAEKGSSFDYIGAALYAVALSSLIYGFSTLPQLSGFVFIGVGTALLITFGWYEKRQTDPVFNIKLFLKNKVFRMSLLSALINYASTFAVSFMLSIYLQYIRGFSATDAGLILIAQPLVMTFVTIKAGSLSDRRSPTMLATLGMGFVAVGLFFLSFLTLTTSFYLIIGTLLIFGLGFGLFSSPNSSIIMGSVDAADYGGASAAMGTMRLTGQSFSMGLAMMAFALTIGDTDFATVDPNKLMMAIRLTYGVSAILCAIGVYTSSIRER